MRIGFQLATSEGKKPARSARCGPTRVTQGMRSMKGVLHFIMVGMLGLASAAHAAVPLCWSLSVQPPIVGVTATTLKLYSNDIGGQFMLAGTASYSVLTFPQTNVVLLAFGTATYLNGNIEATLHATGVSSQSGLETRDYYLVLNTATLNGSFISGQSGTANLIACN